MYYNNVIKALEKALTEVHAPVGKHWACGFLTTHTIKSTLDLIQHQKAENSALQHEKTELEIELTAMRGAANSYKSEIERLKPFEEKIAEYNSSIRVEDMLVFASSLGEWLEFCDNLKAEAYKEFAERLKKEALIDSGYEVLPIGTIDNLLEEMESERD